MTVAVTEAGLAPIDPAAYADEDRLHEGLARPRREAPVHWVEAPGYEKFWAVTRHADIMENERNNSLFLDAPGRYWRPRRWTLRQSVCALSDRGWSTAALELVTGHTGGRCRTEACQASGKR